MSNGPLNLEMLRSLAAVQGLKLSDERLERLLPQVQRSIDGGRSVEALELADTPPAVTFWPVDSRGPT